MRALFENAPQLLTVYFSGDYPHRTLAPYYKIGDTAFGERPQNFDSLKSLSKYCSKDLLENTEGRTNISSQLLNFYLHASIENFDFNALQQHAYQYDHCNPAVAPFGYKILRENERLFLYQAKTGYKIEIFPNGTLELISTGHTGIKTEEISNAFKAMTNFYLMNIPSTSNFPEPVPIVLAFDEQYGETWQRCSEDCFQYFAQTFVKKIKIPTEVALGKTSAAQRAQAQFADESVDRLLGPEDLDSEDADSRPSPRKKNDELLAESAERLLASNKEVKRKAKERFEAMAEYSRQQQESAQSSHDEVMSRAGHRSVWDSGIGRAASAVGRWFSTPFRSNEQYQPHFANEEQRKYFTESSDDDNNEDFEQEFYDQVEANEALTLEERKAKHEKEKEEREAHKTKPKTTRGVQTDSRAKPPKQKSAEKSSSERDVPLEGIGSSGVFSEFEEGYGSELEARARNPVSSSSDFEDDSPFVKGEPVGEARASAVPESTTKRILIIHVEKINDEIFNQNNVLRGPKVAELSRYFEGWNFRLEGNTNIIALSKGPFSIKINPTTNTIRIEGPENPTQKEAKKLTQMVHACHILKFRPLQLEIEGLRWWSGIFLPATTNMHNRALQDVFEQAQNDLEKTEPRLVETLDFTGDLDRNIIDKLHTPKYKIDFYGAEHKIRIYRTTRAFDEENENFVINAARENAARACAQLGLTIHIPEPVPTPSVLEQARSAASAIGSGIQSGYRKVKAKLGKKPAVPVELELQDMDATGHVIPPAPAPAVPVAPLAPAAPVVAPTAKTSKTKSAFKKVTRTLTSATKPLVRNTSFKQFIKNIRNYKNIETEGNVAFQLALNFENGPTPSEIRTLLSRLSAGDRDFLNIVLQQDGFVLEKIRNHYYLVHVENKSRIALTKNPNQFAWTTTEKNMDDDSLDAALSAMLEIYIKITPDDRLNHPEHRISAETVHGDEAHHYKQVEVANPDGTKRIELEPRDPIGEGMEQIKEYVRAKQQKYYQAKRRSILEAEKITQENVDPDMLQDAGAILLSEIYNRDSVFQHIETTLQDSPLAFDFDQGDFTFSRVANRQGQYQLTSGDVKIQVNLFNSTITTSPLNNSADYEVACRGMTLLHDALDIPQDKIRVQNKKALWRDQQDAAERILDEEYNKFYNATIYFKEMPKKERSWLSKKLIAEKHKHARSRVAYVRVGNKWYKSTTGQDNQFVDLVALDTAPNLNGFDYYNFNYVPDEDLPQSQADTPAHLEDIAIQATKAMNRDAMLFGTRGTLISSDTEKLILADRDKADSDQDHYETQFSLCGNQYEGYYLLNPESEGGQTAHKIKVDVHGNTKSEYFRGEEDNLEKLIQALVNNMLAQIAFYNSLPAEKMRGKTVNLETIIPTRAHSAKAMTDYNTVAAEVARRTQQMVQANFTNLPFEITYGNKPAEAGYWGKLSFTEGYIGQLTELPKKVSPLVPTGPSNTPGASISFGNGAAAA